MDLNDLPDATILLLRVNRLVSHQRSNLDYNETRDHRSAGDACVDMEFLKSMESIMTSSDNEGAAFCPQIQNALDIIAQGLINNVHTPVNRSKIAKLEQLEPLCVSYSVDSYNVDEDESRYDLSEYTRALYDVADRIDKGWKDICTYEALGVYTKDEPEEHRNNLFASIQGDVNDEIFEELLGVSKAEYERLDRDAKYAAQLKAAQYDGSEDDMSEHTRVLYDVYDRIDKGWSDIRNYESLGVYTKKDVEEHRDNLFASILGDNIDDEIFQDLLGVNKTEYELLDREAKDAVQLKVIQR